MTSAPLLSSESELVDPQQWPGRSLRLGQSRAQQRSSRDNREVSEPTVNGRLLYRQLLLDEELMVLRDEFCRTVTKQLANIAAWIGIDSLLGAGDVVDTAGPIVDRDPARYAAFRGASAVIEIAAQLAAGIESELEAVRRYTAAGLARQLIEAEYLLRAFVDDITRAGDWYTASPDDIRRYFMPKTMRPLGDFSEHEYWSHCDQGGHPSPQGARLLRFGVHTDPQHDQVMTASLWGDFAQHLSRVWSATYALLATHHARFVTVHASAIAEVEEVGKRWSGADPLSQQVDFKLLNQLAAESHGRSRRGR